MNEASTVGLPSTRVQVVGLGASAGGIDALERFFSAVKAPSGLAFVVVQHVSPEHKSLMVDILGRRTELTVQQAADGQALAPDRVYMVPPGKRFSVHEGAIRLQDAERGQGGGFSIDAFFESLAASFGERAIAVVLSGTGSDGTAGVRAVKHVGGLVLVQQPESAQFDGMPRSAIESGAADFVLAPQDMPGELATYLAGVDGEAEQLEAVEREALLSELLALLSAEVGIDFAEYKRATVLRRVTRRMLLVGSTSLAHYLQRARGEPSELRALYKELLIGVTRFFRDPEAFEALREHALRPLVELDDPEPIRIWVAGCATGEEAYSIAILLRELLDDAHSPREAKIFATDLDQTALATAAQGVYARTAVEGMSERRLETFFTSKGEDVVVSPRLRSMVLFAHHNLLRSPPFTRLDLVSCRNVLIYFEPHLQQGVLATLHFALKSGGKLLLGPSDNVGAMGESFAVVDAKHRLFAAVGAVRLPLERAIALRGAQFVTPLGQRNVPTDDVRLVQAATQLMLSHYAPSGLLVDEAMHLLHVFGRPSTLLRVATGAATLNVLRMVDGAMAAVLGAAVPRALATGKESVYYGLHLEGIPADVSIRVRAVAAAEGGRRAVLIVFERDPSLTVDGLVEVVNVRPETGQQLEELKRELDLIRETLQVTVEELQTANEELQAANEELLSANEELQCTNEELHSTNEELHTINAASERKNQELSALNNDIDNLLRSTNIGTVFLDAQLRIRKFTPAAVEYIPLRERDVGRPLADLAIDGHGVDVLGVARGVLASRSEHELPFDVRDRHALVRIRPYVDEQSRVDGVVIAFVDITQWKRAVLRTQRILDSLPQHVALLDRAGTILMVNRAWTTFACCNEGAHSYLGWNYLDTCRVSNDDELAGQAAEGLRAVLSGAASSFDFEYPCHAPDEQRWFVLHAAAVAGGDGAVVSHLDITQRKRAELALEAQALIDPLTSLFNRRGIDQELAHVSRAALRDDESPVAIVVEWDDAERVRDTLGHATGDLVLQELARRLREGVGPAAHLARIGDAQFLALLPGAPLAQAGELAERLCQGAATPVALSHGPLVLTLSAAVLAIDERLSDLAALVSAARPALRAAQALGRNRVFVRGRTGGGLAGPQARGSLEVLIGHDEALGTFRQPIVRLDTTQIVGFEYLTRGPIGPFHLPLDLFQAASEFGLLNSIDLMCLRLCVKRSRTEAAGLWHHVNLYPSSLLDTPLERLAALFPSDGSAGSYCVELSEPQIPGDPSSLLGHVAGLRRLGVRVALEHVGVGRTSLETLLLLEPEVLKLDRRSVADVAESATRARALERLLRVARSLDALVIAEGVETAEEARALKELGVQYVQGFYFARPEALPT